MSNDPWYSLGITPVEALWVVVSAIGIYAVFFLLIRSFGQRSLASWSTLDKAIVIALGGVVGRVILGYTPTLAAGIIGLLTLFTMMRLEEYLRRTKRGVYLSSRPVLLMAGAKSWRTTSGEPASRMTSSTSNCARPGSTTSPRSR